jgi:cytoskeletal protein CcmA (bactofilin family)
MIGPSIKIKGNLSGNEDLVIQGRIDGEVLLKRNQVTVGPNGKVKANIHGKSICVEGEVRGDLVGSEEVIIRASGKVQGNIVSPRVTLDNGSKFKGSIDMEPNQDTSKPAAASESATAAKPERPELDQKVSPPAGTQAGISKDKTPELQAEPSSGSS